MSVLIYWETSSHHPRLKGGQLLSSKVLGPHRCRADVAAADGDTIGDDIDLENQAIFC